MRRGVVSRFSCIRLCDTMDCSLPGSSVQGILQARTLEWVAMPSFRGSSRPRGGTRITLCLLHWQASSLSLLLLFSRSDFLQPHVCQASLSFTISQSLLKLMSIELVMPSTYLILSHPCLLLPSIFPSIRVFSSELALHIRWPKYWSFSFSISPSKVHSGLTSCRINWFDFLAVQGTLKSLLQHHCSKA